ncbi:MAG TPA: sulfate permease [Anaerolineales bacterium]|nr:sulfate permease [Anaerolineales bacterium]
MNTEAGVETTDTVTSKSGRIVRPVTAAEQKGIWKWMPGLQVLRHYDPSWLRNDLAAGLVLTAVLVPVGMGYAEAAGLPAINGLYATIVPLIAYAIFGPSRILVLGPDSSLAAIIAAVILPLSAGDPTRAVTLAGMLALFTGLLCILAGLARLGIITELLSKPIRYGYMNGIALTVLIGQLPKLFGFSIEGDNVIAEFASFIQGLLAGMTNWVTLALGASTLLFILATKRFKRFPGILVAVVMATIVTGFFALETQAGVSVLGPLPQGLPSFSAPLVSWQDVGPLMVGAIAIAVVSFADTSVLSRSLAAKSGTYVNSNQEMIGLGAANVATGFFQGFSISSSASRTPVAESAGSKTQLTGVTGAVAIALLLIFAPTLLKNLPNTALAAVVIASAIGLFEITDLRRFYRIQRWEFWLSMACFLGVAIFGPIPGILIAILVALGEFVGDAWRPHSAVLGRPNKVVGYHDTARYPDARLIPGLLLFRWDAPLFFANAEQFKEQVLIEVNKSPTPVNWLVVAAEPITGTDVSAADMLVELDDELQQAGIQLIFAEMKDPVKDKLKNFGMSTRFDDRRFYPTIKEAVDAYLESHKVDWKDWDDEE